MFKDNLIQTRQLETETALARASAEEQRKLGMHQMADALEQSVGEIVGLVPSSAIELQATTQVMTATATETAIQSTAGAAAEAASNVNTVAEELGSSVQEIGRQFQGSAELAHTAVAEADHTADLVQVLKATSAKIGDMAFTSIEPYHTHPSEPRHLRRIIAIADKGLPGRYRVRRRACTLRPGSEPNR